MPTLKNKHWEVFAQNLAKGEIAPVAFEKAGYSSKNPGNASRLACRSEIKLRVQEIQTNAARRSEITVQRVVEGIGAIAFNELGDVSYQNQLRGYELLGRYLSIFQDNLNVTTTSDLAQRMRDAQKRLRELRDITPKREIEG